MKDRRHLIIIFLIFSLLLTMTVAYATGSEPRTTSAKAAALYEPRNKTLIFGKNERARLPMASTTKIMTAILAIELCDENEVAEITEESVGIEGSSVYLKNGQRLTVGDLLYSVLLQSANDASNALAIHICGSSIAFADLMNEKAKMLGLSDTHFENPHGLDSPNHFTTALDLAKLASYAMENERFKEIVSTYKYEFDSDGSKRVLVNHNKLLKRYEGCIGIKTGYTKKSGRCLVSAAERNGLRLISVTLSAPDDWNDHASLFDYGFESYEAVSLSSLTRTVFELNTVNGKEDTVPVSTSPKTDEIIIKRKSNTNLKAELHLPKFLCAPLKAGQAVGYIDVLQNGEKIKRYELIVQKDISLKEKRRKFLWF